MSTCPRAVPPTAVSVSPEGADWLASISPFPCGLRALWAKRPTAPVVLPCGVTFDVISVPALFGRRMIDRLWAEGPGTGPVGTQRERVLFFATPGTAQRLPALMAWEEWRTAGVPPMQCHGPGDAITVPPPRPTAGGMSVARWLVPPDARHPWLPGPDVLRWACVRAARGPGRTAVTSTPTLCHAHPGLRGTDFHSARSGC